MSIELSVDSGYEDSVPRVTCASTSSVAKPVYGVLILLSFQVHPRATERRSQPVVEPAFTTRDSK